jgi:hypothetical protein
MSLKFESLNAGSGDCFILTDSNCTKRFMVDGGTKGSYLGNAQYLNSAKLDVIIVTHNDGDHTGGVIELLSDINCVTIKEIWLPATWASIIEYINGQEYIDFPEGFILEENLSDESSEDDLIFEKFSKNEIVLKQKEKYLSTNDSVKFNEDTGYIDNLNIDADYDYTTKEIFELLTSNLSVFCHIGRKSNYFQLLAKSLLSIKINNIQTIYQLARRKKIKIRWFMPKDYLTNLNNNQVRGSNFRALNSEEVFAAPKIKNQSMLLCIAALTPVNAYSLVFEYLNDQTPVVLFSADNDFNFLRSNSLAYQSEILWTAPHHGTNTNALAYRKISSSNKITLVRSGRANRITYYCKYTNSGGVVKYCNSCNLCASASRRYVKLDFKYLTSNWSQTSTHPVCCIGNGNCVFP